MQRLLNTTQLQTKSWLGIILVAVLSISISGCAPQALIPARKIETDKITLGSVQRFVKVGASSSDVVAALGSPNIVTSTKDGGETWVYDKIAFEREYAGGLNSSTTMTSSRSMIVVIKYDKSGIVEKVDYRQMTY
jgi:outer membrane protein assembly factor BamE (lipoprotein component of BamABCDE complex)